MLVAKFTLFGSSNNPSSKFHSQAKTKSGYEFNLSNHLTDLQIYKFMVSAPLSFEGDLKNFLNFGGPKF